MTRLSVIIPAYNSGRTIEDCLRSLRSSTYGDYEIIVVDDGSRDDTAVLAERYADRVIRLRGNNGASAARNQAIQVAGGEIIVNIDADVVVQADTLSTIARFFDGHPGVDAVTGKLTKEQPYEGFFTDYKNLYMHYIFRRLPEQVTFLYGSIHALKRDSAELLYDHDVRRAHDTALGQHLARLGKQIAFLPALEVTHLKPHTLASFLRNDFWIPYDWGRVFVKYGGWRELGRGRGYAHSPPAQLASVVIAPLTVVLATAVAAGRVPPPWLVPPVLLWLTLNARFLGFLAKERGLIFGALAVSVTFVDHVTMAAGVVSGLASGVLSRLIRRESAV